MHACMMMMMMMLLLLVLLLMMMMIKMMMLMITMITMMIMTIMLLLLMILQVRLRDHNDNGVDIAEERKCHFVRKKINCKCKCIVITNDCTINNIE